MKPVGQLQNGSARFTTAVKDMACFEVGWLDGFKTGWIDTNAIVAGQLIFRSANLFSNLPTYSLVVLTVRFEIAWLDEFETTDGATQIQ